MKQLGFEEISDESLEIFLVDSTVYIVEEGSAFQTNDFLEYLVICVFYLLRPPVDFCL